MKFRLFFMVGLLALIGCTSRRTGYAVDEWQPTPNCTYYEALAHLGNPTTIKSIDSGTEAVWMGSATTGGVCTVGYWGIRFTLGKAHTESSGLRLRFDKKGRLQEVHPIGMPPSWGIVPFGK